jgi:hypothetical protein
MIKTKRWEDRISDRVFFEFMNTVYRLDITGIEENIQVKWTMIDAFRLLSYD